VSTQTVLYYDDDVFDFFSACPDVLEACRFWITLKNRRGSLSTSAGIPAEGEGFAIRFLVSATLTLSTKP
jgi:hypothetical protein